MRILGSPSLAFNAQVAWEAYCAFAEGHLSLDIAIRAVIPLIELLIHTRFPTVEPATQWDLAADCMLHAKELYENKGPSLKNVGAYHMFMRSSFYRVCIHGIDRYKAPVYDLEAVTIHSHVETHGDVEEFIYRQQFRDAVEVLFKQNVRFIGLERKACYYILNCLLERTSLNFTIISQYFNVKKKRALFFVDYVRVLYRAVCYAFREREMSYRTGRLPPQLRLENA
jgi:hypothetical protein